MIHFDNVDNVLYWAVNAQSLETIEHDTKLISILNLIINLFAPIL